MASLRIRQLFLLAAVSVAVDASFAQSPAALPPTKAVSSVRKISPVYPLEALLKGKTGSAEVRYMVDYSGKAVATSVVTTSDPSFGAALLADVESNEFMPPRINGQPQLALSSTRYDFAGEASLDPAERRILGELRKTKPAIVSAKELDGGLKAIRQDPPAYPYAAQSDGLSGRAEIEFIVDRDGRVAFPKVVSSSSDDFGWAACSAITRWRFQPPVKGGQKVDARATVVLNFDVNKGSATWDKF
jgi:TonB family protein